MIVNSHVVAAADGVPIHCDIRGSGTTALVFVHGWACDRAYWRHQVEHFAAAHTVVTLDLPGHGASGRDRAQWSMSTFGDDVVSVVEHFGLKRVVLVGHSMAGSIIVEAARRLSSSVIGLVGVETWRDIVQDVPPAHVGAILAPFRANFVEASRGFTRTMFLPTSNATLVEDIVAAVSAAPADIAIPMVEALFLHNPRVREGLQAVKVPKFTINAADWRPTSADVLRQYGIELLPISGVGHFAMLEDPATFNRLVDEVLQKMPA